MILYLVLSYYCTHWTIILSALQCSLWFQFIKSFMSLLKFISDLILYLASFYFLNEKTVKRIFWLIKKNPGFPLKKAKTSSIYHSSYSAYCTDSLFSLLQRGSDLKQETLKHQETLKFPRRHYKCYCLGQGKPH